jgi:ABC-type bacteriocin/lantibiotic exporter with double-glycine peptidase domain
MNKDIPNLKDSLKQFYRLFILIKPYWLPLIKGMLIGLIVGIMGMAIPYLTKLLIDQVYPTQNFTLLNVLIGAILVFNLASLFIGAVQEYFNLFINTKLTNSVSLMFFNHLQHLKVRFFDEHQVGEIMSRFGDVGSSLSTVNRVFQTFFVNGIYLLIVPPFLFALHWKLALISLISVPITMIIISLTGKILRKYWKVTAEASADINAFQVEVLSNIRSLKALTLEKFVYEKIVDKVKNSIKLQMKAGGMGQLVNLANGIVKTLNTSLLTWIGWNFILSQEMTLGDFIAFAAYIAYLYNPISQFIGLFSEFQHSSINLGRTFEYLDSPVEQDPSIILTDEPKLTKKLSGELTIKNLSFGYLPDAKVLNNINLHIPKGSITSIIGPSGSGKTTLLRLIIGMEKPEEGEIYFDGIPSSNLSLYDIRNPISFVWQEFCMFKGTVWDNLTIGLKDVNVVHVENAIRICRINDLIQSLPNKYDSEISECGSTLSAGQRQRFALARAIIRNSPVLILDEATSNIDMQTEIEILKDIFSFMRGKTVIFVTHRVSSTSLADQICILDNGTISAIGSHLELLNNSEFYRKMHSVSTGLEEDLSINITQNSDMLIAGSKMMIYHVE